MLIKNVEGGFCVAYYWFAKYADMLGIEDIVLEIRYSPGGCYLLHTSIRDRQYHIKGQKFMIVLEEFLSQLPASTSISIVHQVAMIQEGNERLIELIEHISYTGSDDNTQVVYQLTYTCDGKMYTSEPMAEDFTTPLDSLVAQFVSTGYFKVCSFCDLLYIDGMYGGTDERRDMMYCFRDERESLNKIKQAVQKPSLFPRHLSSQVLHEVDALHTCSSFILTEDFIPRLERARKRIQHKMMGSSALVTSTGR